MKRAIVLGMGISGEAAACLLERCGFEVTVVDSCVEEKSGGRADMLRDLGLRVLTGVVSLPAENFELGIVSPGIADSSAWVVELEERGVEVISELELGYRYCLCPLIAVTGTNGKSTLVKFLYEIIVKSGARVEIAGNYGIPLCEVAQRSSELDWIVVEVSSFQLEKIVEFHPKVAVLLNVQPDHLDRHGSMEQYRALKNRLFQNMATWDTAVVNYEDMIGLNERRVTDNSWVSFGRKDKADIYYNGDCEEVRGRGVQGEVRVNLSGSLFANQIMGQTAAAAVAVVQACGIDLGIVSSAAKEFRGLSHRLEQVAVIKGVRFVNDSKATNLAALKAGLEMSVAPVRLIAGGQLKEKSVEFVKEVLANRAICVYIIGDATKVFETEWGECVKCESCSDLESAVRMAWQDASCGETVLLSPGCASFDQFRSYKDRGEQFKRIVEKINEEEKYENIVCD